MGETILPAAPLPNAGTQVVASPFQFAVSGEDNLRVRIWSSLVGETVTVSGRCLGTDGTILPFLYTVVTNGTRTMQESFISLAPGYVISIGAEATSLSVRSGQCYCQVQLVRGLGAPVVTLGTLLQGYVASFAGLFYPGTPLRGPLEGPGWIHHINGKPNAAGAEVSEVAPGNVFWQLKGFRAALTTSAAAGLRVTKLFGLDSGGNVYFTAPSILQHGPSVRIAYHWQPGMTLSGTSVNLELAVPFPTLYPVSFGLLNTSTALLAAGDQWEAAQYVVEEWILPWS